MNNQQSQQWAELIWSDISTIKGSALPREEQIGLIRKRIVDLAFEQRQCGRRQILNHLSTEIENLKK